MKLTTSLNRSAVTRIAPVLLRHYTRRTRAEWEAAFARCEQVVDNFRDDVNTAKFGRTSDGRQVHPSIASHVSVVVERLGRRTEQAIELVLSLNDDIRARHDADLANLVEVADAPLPPPTGDEIAQRAYYGGLVAGMVDGLSTDQVLALAAEQAETPTVIGAPQFGAAWADRLLVLAEQHTRRFSTARVPSPIDIGTAQKLTALAKQLRAPSLPAEARTAHTDRPMLVEVDQLSRFIARSARVRIEALVTRQPLDATVDRFANGWRLGQLIPRSRLGSMNYTSVEELARAMNAAYGLSRGIW